MIVTLPSGVRAEIIRPGEPLKDWLAKQKVKPLALINASLYHSNGKPIGTIIEDGVMVSNEGNGFGFGVSSAGVARFGKPWDTLWQEYITGYTGIVQDGEYVPPSFQDAYVFDKALSRIGIGMRAGSLSIVTYDAMTIAQMGRQAVADGFRTLINLDGGGSRYLYHDGKTYYTSSRTPYNAIAFWAPGSKQEPEDDTMTSTGHQRSAVIDTAKRFLGYNEADGSYREIIDIYNLLDPLPVGYKLKYTDDWCAAFVSAVALEAGMTDIIPTECGCERMAKLAQQRGIWQEADDYAPQPGDIIMYDWNDGADYAATDNKAWADHTGFVERVEGGAIHLIEGNKNGSVQRTTVKVNGRYIRGFITPKYAETAAPPATNEPWYAEAQRWAVAAGITDGTRPNDPMTRAEAWSMLMRMKGE